MRVVILKDIPGQYMVYRKDSSRIRYNKRKGHQLLYQQGRYYGQVGDCAEDVTDNLLQEWESLGYIRVTKGKPMEGE